jgi:hypothetical protein
MRRSPAVWDPGPRMLLSSLMIDHTHHVRPAVSLSCHHLNNILNAATATVNALLHTYKMPS